MTLYLRSMGVAILGMTLAASMAANDKGRSPGGGAGCTMERTVLHDDIAHYRCKVRVGPGPFDVIQLHRVVREQHPYWPVRTVDSIFMLTGAPNTFEMIFMEPLISSVPRWDQSIAVFLAKNGIDVWGMDYAWALVPPETTDFTFMNDWTVETDAQHAQIGLSMARWIRTSTGQGHGRLHLLGFSWGGPVAYAVAGDETQKPPGHRNVKGLIQADTLMKWDNEEYRLSSCGAANGLQALLDAGVYHDSSGAFPKQAADLAKSDPSGESPFAPPLTNFQFILLLGISPQPPPPGWHFVGGYLDSSGVPTGLRFTDPGLWVDMLRAVPPFMPNKALWELNAASCGEVDVAIDAHLGEIRVPILFAGAAGGFGPYGYYTTSLTASQDITKFTVQLLPDDEQAYDFGHADLFSASSAEALVWKPILDWIVAHR